MATLANFPLITQQTSISADGSSPNAEMDCVPTSILAGMMYLKGITQLSKDWNPDKLLDMAYPEGYKGGTSASSFVKACASLGVKLSPIDGQPVDLVKAIHQHIQANHPCVVTVPDIYVPASYGWTHVLCMYGEDSTKGTLTALDPWPGKPTTKSDAEWANLLQDNQIWILESEDIVISISTPGVGNYFTETAPGWWLCKNGKQVHGEILAFYTRVGGYGLCGVSDLGLPVSNEIALDAKGNTKQHFERGVVFFDPGHVFDNPPGAGRVYKAHLYSGPGVDPAIALLQSELAKATQAPQQFAALEQMVEVGASALGKHLV